MCENVTPVMINEAISAVRAAIVMLARVSEHHAATASMIEQELTSMLPEPKAPEVVPMHATLPRRKKAKVETVEVVAHVNQAHKPKEKPRTDAQALNLLTGILKKEDEITVERARELIGDKSGARLARLHKAGKLYNGDAVVRLTPPLPKTPLLTEASNDQLFEELFNRCNSLDAKKGLKAMNLLEKLAKLL